MMPDSLCEGHICKNLAPFCTWSLLKKKIKKNGGGWGFWHSIPWWQECSDKSCYSYYNVDKIITGMLTFVGIIITKMLKKADLLHVLMQP